ncbi:hypothetical protein QYF36_015962 [Acer negundo]|nr:hypothetical protein QYF36_015962 [Acer negundo]
MGSAVINKPPSPFLTFVYCFLLISFLFYIPRRIVAEHVKDGASRVHGSPSGHAPNAVQQGSPKQSSPTQNNPNSVAGKAVRCSPITSYNCIKESGESMYNWVEGETPKGEKNGASATSVGAGPLRHASSAVQQVGEGSGKSGVGPGPLRHAPSEVQHGSPTSPKQSSPIQKKPESIVITKSLNGERPTVNCGGRGRNYKCLPDPKSRERGVTPGGRH